VAQAPSYYCCASRDAVFRSAGYTHSTSKWLPWYPI